jgi:hypothetical protein
MRAGCQVGVACSRSTKPVLATARTRLGQVGLGRLPPRRRSILANASIRSGTWAGRGQVDTCLGKYPLGAGWGRGARSILAKASIRSGQGWAAWLGRSLPRQVAAWGRGGAAWLGRYLPRQVSAWGRGGAAWLGRYLPRQGSARGTWGGRWPAPNGGSHSERPSASLESLRRRRSLRRRAWRARGRGDECGPAAVSRACGWRSEDR